MKDYTKYAKEREAVVIKHQRKNGSIANLLRELSRSAPKKDRIILNSAASKLLTGDNLTEYEYEVAIEYLFPDAPQINR